jgi:RAVE protein 1 C terminal
MLCVLANVTEAAAAWMRGVNKAVFNQLKLQVHPTSALAVSADRSGRLTLWQSAQLSPEPTPALSVATSAQPILALAWLSHVPDTEPQAPTTSSLAVCTSTELILVPVLHATGWPGASSFVPASLQAPSCRVALPARWQGALSAGAALTVAAAQQAAQSTALVTVALSASGADALGADELHTATFSTTGLSGDEAAVLLVLDGAREHLAGPWDVVSQMSGKEPGVLCARGHPHVQLAAFTSAGESAALWARTQEAGDEPVAAGVVAAVHADSSALAAATVVASSADAARLTIWRLLQGAEGLLAGAEQTLALPGNGPWAVQVVPAGFGGYGIAVAAPQRVMLFAKVGARWREVARATVPGVPHSLRYAHNALFAALPSQIVAFSPVLQTPHGQTALETLAVVARAPLPPWHPRNLIALLACGAHDAALALVRELLAVLKGLRSTPNVHALLEAVGAAAVDLLALTAGLHEEQGSIKATPPVDLVASLRLPATAPNSTTAQKVEQPRDPSAPSSAAGTEHAAHNALGADRATSALRPGQPAAEAMSSGHIDMSAFGLSSTPAKQRSARTPTVPQSMLDSGQLAMGAFGSLGAQPAPAAASTPVDTGQIDLGAFGMAATAPHPPPSARASAPQGALDTGQVGMSAFGARAPARQQPAAQVPAHAPGALDTGHIDLGAFGMAAPAPQKPAAQPPAAAPSALDSGQVDLSAFDTCAPAPQQPAARPPAAAPSTLNTGQVDLSAFGMAGPAPQQPAAQPPAAPRNALDTGQVDLSAFSMAAPAPEWPAAQPPAAAASALDTGQVDLSAFGMSPAAQASGAPHSGTAHQKANPSQPLGEGTSARLCTGSGDVPQQRTAGEACNSRCSSVALPAQGSSTVSACDSAEIGDGGSHAARPVAEAVQVPGSPERRAHPLPLGSFDHAVAAVLSELESSERHRCAAEQAMTRAELEQLQTVASMTHAAAAKEGRISCSELGISVQNARLLVALADAFCTKPVERRQATKGLTALEAPLSALDIPGRRMVSAVRVGATLLSFEWAEATVQLQAAQAAATGAQSGGDGGAGRNKPRLSASAAQLLATLRGGASGAAAGQANSAKAAEAALSREAARIEPPEQPHWSKLGLLPTLDHAGLLWAFDCSAPAALLDVLMEQMPQREPEAAAGYQPAGATSSAFSSAISGPKVGANAWTWANFCRIGAALWLTHSADVLRAVDRIAKTTFAAKKQALNVALWYCAQGRLSAIGALLRTTGDSKVAAFFTRDFSTADARAAAAKNAHKLLSQHRYALAAAFFLCGRDAAAAIDTCLYQLHDVHLAIVLCRVLDASPTSPVATESPTPRGAFAAALFQRLLTDAELPRSGMTAVLLRRAVCATAVPVDAELVQRMAAPGTRSTSSMSTELARLVAPVQAADWLLHTVLQNAAGRHAGRTVSHAAPLALAGPDAVQQLAATAAQAAAALEDNGMHAAAARNASVVSACAHARATNQAAGIDNGMQERACARMQHLAACIALQVSTAKLLRLQPASTANDSSHNLSALTGGLDVVLRGWRQAGVEVQGDARKRCASVLQALAASGECPALQSAGVLPTPSAVAEHVQQLLQCTWPPAPRAKPGAPPASGRRATPHLVPVDASTGAARTPGATQRTQQPGEPGLLNAAASTVVLTVGEKDAQVSE